PFSKLKALPYRGKNIKIALEAVLQKQGFLWNGNKIIHLLDKPIFQRAPKIRDAANLIHKTSLVSVKIWRSSPYTIKYQP
ncbi:hypothetical protein N9136_03150, partial [bacterium]|nr:hypothetical protein [bacterium]